MENQMKFEFEAGNGSYLVCYVRLVDRSGGWDQRLNSATVRHQFDAETLEMRYFVEAGTMLLSQAAIAGLFEDPSEERSTQEINDVGGYSGFVSSVAEAVGWAKAAMIDRQIEAQASALTELI